MSLGELLNVPYFYEYFMCARCKIVSRLNRPVACRCSQITKYNSMKVIINNLEFDSLKEGKRYSKLAFLLDRKIIRDLDRQVKFKIEINEKFVFSWTADFQYFYEEKKITEDVKGRTTPTFNLKMKIIRAMYPDLIIYLT